MKNSSFRHWLQEKWYEHIDECERWQSMPCENLKEYFGKYRWWLKREYKHQSKKGF